MSPIHRTREGDAIHGHVNPGFGSVLDADGDRRAAVLVEAVRASLA